MRWRIVVYYLIKAIVYGALAFGIGYLLGIPY